MVDSTTEAEYITASDVAKEAIWITNFVFRLGFVPSITNPVDVYCDNNGAITQAKEPRSHQRSKHILKLSTSFVRSLREEILRYVEFILMTMLLILLLNLFNSQSMIVILDRWAFDLCLIGLKASGRLLVICSSPVAYTLSLYVYIHEAFIILSCYLNCGLT